jgi:glutaminase
LPAEIAGQRSVGAQYLAPVPYELDDDPAATERTSRVSTGELPAEAEVRAAIAEAHARYQGLRLGAPATYIPALARANPEWFGICVVGARGAVLGVGDVDQPFSIQSISKAFTFALVCEAVGAGVARRKLGVNATGLPFNSVMAVELNDSRTMNPMVNAGAIATTSLVPGATAADKWERISSGLSAFAGRPLVVDDEVYESEMASNLRNQGIAHLLAGYEHLYSDPDEATEVYTRQCSLSVTAVDLAVMGATLADGGVNPRTGVRVVSAATCRRVLAVLATAGLYERSGDWLYDVGLPGKSGVSGGIVTIAPGKGGLGVFSPRLDDAGNSVRGQAATHYLSLALGLDLFASEPRV